MPPFSEKISISSYFIQYISQILAKAYKTPGDLIHNYLFDFYFLMVSSVLTLLQAHSGPGHLYILFLSSGMLFLFICMWLILSSTLGLYSTVIF